MLACLTAGAYDACMFDSGADALYVVLVGRVAYESLCDAGITIAQQFGGIALGSRSSRCRRFSSANWSVNLWLKAFIPRSSKQGCRLYRA